MWIAIKQKEKIPLVKWYKVANLKELGGWGIKNLILFSQLMATKSLWRLAQNTDTLWGKEMTLKYYTKSSIIEWSRSSDKNHKVGSVGWKVFM